ncbi:MAG: alpha/beta hydrolase [Lachnospiraceae bacterium]|nr:alpha/beta hydrolase [Lachnospiraceae bacterium]
MKKRIKKFLVVIAVLMVIIILPISVMAVWNSIETKKDLEVIAGAKYGEFFTNSNGDRVNYTLYDSKSEQIAVIIPGLESVSAHYEFDALAIKLADKYKVVVYEPPGVGLSDWTDTERSVENFTKELHELMQHLGYDRYTIIAHSFAGLYSLYYTNQYPDEVEAFIGIDATVPAEIEEADHEAYANAKRLRTIMIKSGLLRLASSEEVIKGQFPTAKADELELCKALWCSAQYNDIRLNEYKSMVSNEEKCMNLTFPDTVPVLYILANDTVSEDAKWEQLHKDVITNEDSKVSIILGDHYLHQSNFRGLVNEITSWDVRH